MPDSDPDFNATRLHWDEQADSYDAAKRRNDVYYSALKRCFADAIPTGMRGRVLDVGCGTGQILASLNPREGIGIDLSPRMIDIAQRRFSDQSNLRFETSSVDNVASHPGGLFDAVISSDMLEHADDWRAAVVAMTSACRPDGLIVISTPNPTWTFPLWVLEKLHLKMPEGPHRFVWAGAVAEHLRNLGCVVTICRTTLLIPIGLAGLGPAVSTIAERIPLTNRLGVIQLIVAERRSP